jgi:hypothetical protein
MKLHIFLSFFLDESQNIINDNNKVIKMSCCSRDKKNIKNDNTVSINLPKYIILCQSAYVPSHVYEKWYENMIQGNNRDSVPLSYREYFASYHSNQKYAITCSTCMEKYFEQNYISFPSHIKSIIFSYVNCECQIKYSITEDDAIIITFIFPRKILVNKKTEAKFPPPNTLKIINHGIPFCHFDLNDLFNNDIFHMFMITIIKYRKIILVNHRTNTIFAQYFAYKFISYLDQFATCITLINFNGVAIGNTSFYELLGFYCKMKFYNDKNISEEIIPYTKEFPYSMTEYFENLLDSRQDMKQLCKKIYEQWKIENDEN